MRLTLILAAAALCASGAAQAQRVSNLGGLTLMKACTGADITACDAYVDGFGDAISAEGKDAALACLPIHATGTELRDTLVAYLRAHPEDQHKKAVDIIKKAFAKAYPCRT